MKMAKTGLKSVLLIDDEVPLFRIIERLAAGSHVELIHAATGADGVRLAADHRPHLIVLDMTLPDIDGLTVLDCLKSAPQTRGIPVIIFSGRCDHEERIAAFRLGAEDYLEKPFDSEMLLRRIEHHIFKASETIKTTGTETVDPRSASGRRG
ncbi:MAG TPA: response regulator [Polyangiaceae bacterium]|nr:response regulator [Polyangiaceae bacterium]